MAAAQKWLDLVHERLRALGPGEWLQLGPLFDEVRLMIPYTSAMRRMATHLEEGEVPNGDKAQWLAFTGKLCGDVEYQPKRRWIAYTDQMRLLKQADCDCGGPVVKVRARRRLGLCLACRKDIALLPPVRRGTRRLYQRAMVNLPLPAAEPSEPISSRSDAMQPPPMATQVLQLSKAKGLRMDRWRTFTKAGPNGQVLSIQIVDRRRCAVMIRNLVPMARKGSINNIVRMLEQSHDDVPAVLRRFGIDDLHALVMLMNNRYMLEQLGLT